MRVFPVVGILFAAIVATPAQSLEVEMLKPIVVAKIDKATQRMSVFVNGIQEYSWKVSTGRGRYDTPVGSHKPYRMHKMWYSRKYQMTPMPYSVFYNGGYAVHGTKALWRLGQPASHGCVRLSTKNAKLFYGLVKQHGRLRTEIAINGTVKKQPVYAARSKRRTRRQRYASYQEPYRRRVSYYNRSRARYRRGRGFFGLFR